MPCYSVTSADADIESMNPAILTLTLSALKATDVSVTVQGEAQFVLHGKLCRIENGKLTVVGVRDAESVASELRAVYFTQSVQAVTAAYNWRNVVQVGATKYEVTA